MSTRVGMGYDSHRFTDGDSIMLGGEKIPFEKGLAAHSDGDALLHALCDALLGAAALGDIGQHFPDHDPAYQNIESGELVKKVMLELRKNDFQVGNVDCTVILEKPKLSIYVSAMQKNISGLLNIDERNVNIKASTNEGMGFIGRGEGIAAIVVVMLNEKV